MVHMKREDTSRNTSDLITDHSDEVRSRTAGALPRSVNMTSVVNSLLRRQGGIKGLMTQFERAGLRATLKSWLLPGSKRPVTAEQIHLVVGPSLMCEFAAKLGLSPQVLAERLSDALPRAISSLSTQPRGLTGNEAQ
jgi:uncharacterized protein YidB (DUF937 family)